MPRVKIDYVVSFSSEDKENPASNLLSAEISKKKWLCGQWEPASSVVLQLARAVQIESVNIGVHHAALVEVLVGLSEKPNDPFEVLVPSCVFVSAADSRRGERAERVRGFCADQLAPARARRWDRVRVVCSQPYNKRVQYGLSFVHIHSNEGTEAPQTATTNSQPSTQDASSAAADTAAAAPAPLSRLLGLDTLYSSDDDEFRPGELFAQRNTNTDAQIRQASSQALNNISDASTKLVKTPMARTNRPGPDGEQRPDRRRDSLLYAADDAAPHQRIDRLVQAHRDEQQRARKRSADGDGTADSGRAKKERVDRESSKEKQIKEDKAQRERERTRSEVPLKDEKRSDSNNRNKFPNRNENASEGRGAVTPHKPQTKTDGAVLEGVVFSISGYENPRRARVRDAALRLGARYEPHHLQRCTHLLCAFPNTPKLRELQRVSPGARAVRAEWVEHAERARRRPPEAAYAPDRKPPPAPAPRAASPPPPPPDSDADTDEIERVRAGGGRGEEEDFSDDGGDTDEEEPPPKCSDPKRLPALFGGAQVVLDAALPAREAALAARYLRAYGALVLQPDEVLDESSVDYVVCGGGGGGGAGGGRWAGGGGGGGAGCGPRRVSPRWVWRCHRKQKLCAVND